MTVLAILVLVAVLCVASCWPARKHRPIVWLGVGRWFNALLRFPFAWLFVAALLVWTVVTSIAKRVAQCAQGIARDLLAEVRQLPEGFRATASVFTGINWVRMNEEIEQERFARDLRRSLLIRGRIRKMAP